MCKGGSEFGQWRNHRLTLDACIVLMEGSKVAEHRRGGRDGAVLLLAPPSFCFPSLFSFKSLKLDMTKYPAEPLVGFKDAKVVDGVSSGEVEEDKGHDDLLIRPSLRLHLEMGGDAFSQVEDRGQVQVDGKAPEGCHTACLFLFFILVGQKTLCHNRFTSLVIVCCAHFILSSLIYQDQRGISLFFDGGLGNSRILLLLLGTVTVCNTRHTNEN